MGIAKNFGNSLTNSVTAVTKPSWAQCFPGTLPHVRVDILLRFATQHKTATRDLCQPPERSGFCCSCERGACVRVCVCVLRDLNASKQKANASPKRPPPRFLTTSNTYDLRVHVYQAKDLPAADANGLDDPYVNRRRFYFVPGSPHAIRSRPLNSYQY